MKKIALGISCTLDTQNKRLRLSIPPDVSSSKLKAWNEANRAWVWSKLLKEKAKSITI